MLFVAACIQALVSLLIRHHVVIEMLSVSTYIQALASVLITRHVGFGTLFLANSLLPLVRLFTRMLESGMASVFFFW